MTTAEPATDGSRAAGAPPVAIVVFGASGDLTQRKILPALAHLVERSMLPRAFSVVGVARTPWNDEDFQRVAIQSVPDAGPQWREAVSRFRYVAGEYGHPDTFESLRQVLEGADQEHGTAGNRLFYLATLPAMFGVLADALGKHGMASAATSGRFTRLVVEKPFGRDLESATALDKDLHRSFDESQIYRIDHYMGKETVQNVLALRFANAVFEPVWNRRYVDHVQITVAESIGVEHRGGFYETAGALRDIVQNHVMAVLSLTMMEPPTRVDAEGIRDEKVKLLRAVEILDLDQVATHAVRGQYVAGSVDGARVAGYREEDDVDPASRIETFVAMRLHVDNWRWAGVPVYVRTGKRLPVRATEVALQFRPVPHLPFSGRLARALGPNTLIVRIQPDEGICLRFGAKVPGQEFRIQDVAMDFSYGATFPEPPHDAYERLLLDAVHGDPTLFIRTDEVDQAWRIVSPILDAWEAGEAPLSRYPAGTWGPEEAVHLIGRDGRQWIDPAP